MVPTKEQIEAANRFHAYRKGWRDSHRLPYRDQEFDGHVTLGDFYRQGWADGIEAHSDAMAKAMRLYGYTPSVLR